MSMTSGRGAEKEERKGRRRETGMSITFGWERKRRKG